MQNRFKSSTKRVIACAAVLNGTAALVVSIPQRAYGVTYSSADIFDLNPAGDTSSVARGISGSEVVGYAGIGPNGNLGSANAVLWSGAAASAVNMSPPGSTQSVILGTDGYFQVGANGGHATLWENNSPGSAIDLNPTGFASSELLSVAGGQEVGDGETSAGARHALLWTGSSASAVDLNPTNLPQFFDTSYALATDGVQQVGQGEGASTGGNIHALLWSGTASTAVDLNPTDLPGINQSLAFGISGNQQVGFGWGAATGGLDHAILLDGLGGFGS